MKRISSLFLASLVISASLHAGTVEVSFDYQRQGGFASNQFAVWVEDSAGAVVRTLSVTDFTAGRGGWEYRRQSIPLWVKNAGVADMKKEEIDVFTRATPPSGRVVERWSCDDSAGRPVPAGEYAVHVEATLRAEKGVLYRGVVKVGGPAAELSPAPEYSGADAPERGMIGNVRIRYIP